MRVQSVPTPSLGISSLCLGKNPVRHPQTVAANGRCPSFPFEFNQLIGMGSHMS